MKRKPALNKVRGIDIFIKKFYNLFYELSRLSKEFENEYRRY